MYSALVKDKKSAFMHMCTGVTSHELSSSNEFGEQTNRRMVATYEDQGLFTPVLASLYTALPPLSKEQWLCGHKALIVWILKGRKSKNLPPWNVKRHVQRLIFLFVHNFFVKLIVKIFLSQLANLAWLWESQPDPEESIRKGIEGGPHTTENMTGLINEPAKSVKQ